MDNDKKFTVAIELDGILCDRGYPDFGNAIEGASNFLNAISKFATIVIYTTRTNSSHNANQSQLKENIIDIKEFLDSHYLFYDSIYCGVGKPNADAYIDNKAVYIRKNPSIKDFFHTLQEVKDICKN